jgi:hypothetical protein
MPRYLEISGRVLTFDWRLGETYHESEHSRLLALPLDDNYDLLMGATWSTRPEQPSALNPVQGILFTTGVHAGNIGALEYPTILLVQRRGDHYERVGVLDLKKEFRGVIQGHATRGSRLEFRHRHTGLTTSVGTDKPNPYTHPDKLGPFPSAGAGELWIWGQFDWQKFFLEDTIILG